MLQQPNSNSNQFEEDVAMFDDACQLDQRLQKINELNNAFDMLRINQLTNSPIRSPNIRGTQTSTLKETQSELAEEKIIMHTPVITGRVESIDDSPNEKMTIKLKQEIVEKKQKHQRQESLSYL